MAFGSSTGWIEKDGVKYRSTVDVSIDNTTGAGDITVTISDRDNKLPQQEIIQHITKDQIGNALFNDKISLDSKLEGLSSELQTKSLETYTNDNYKDVTAKTDAIKRLTEESTAKALQSSQPTLIKETQKPEPIVTKPKTVELQSNADLYKDALNTATIQPKIFSEAQSRKQVLDYVTAPQATIMIGGVILDEAYDLQYSYREMKEPIYGYLDKYFSAMIPGTVIVTGSFTINYKHDQYLRAVIQQGDSGIIPNGTNTNKQNPMLTVKGFQDEYNNLLGQIKKANDERRYWEDILNQLNNQKKVAETKNKLAAINNKNDIASLEKQITDVQAQKKAIVEAIDSNTNRLTAYLNHYNPKQYPLTQTYDANQGWIYTNNGNILDEMLNNATESMKKSKSDVSDYVTAINKTTISNLTDIRNENRQLQEEIDKDNEIIQKVKNITSTTGDSWRQAWTALGAQYGLQWLNIADSGILGQYDTVNKAKSEISRIQSLVDTNNKEISNLQKEIDTNNKFSDQEIAVARELHDKMFKGYPELLNYSDLVSKEWNAKARLDILEQKSITPFSGKIETKDGLKNSGEIDLKIREFNTKDLLDTLKKTKDKMNSMNVNLSLVTTEPPANFLPMRAEDQNDYLKKSDGFDLVINYNNYRHKTLKNCHIIGHSHIIEHSGKPIKEYFQFISQKID